MSSNTTLDSNKIETKNNLPDQVYLNLPQEYLDEIKPDPWKDYLPAGISLISAILSVFITWRVTNRMERGNKENLAKELEESRKIKMAEIKASINISNRQAWMNDFRETVKEYVAVITMVTLKLDKGDGRETLEKIFNLNAKLDLLLHPDREDDKIAIDSYKKMFGFIIQTQSDKKDYSIQISNERATLIETSRKILDKNWQKMNSIELE